MSDSIPLSELDRLKVRRADLRRAIDDPKYDRDKLRIEADLHYHQSMVDACQRDLEKLEATRAGARRELPEVQQAIEVAEAKEREERLKAKIEQARKLAEEIQLLKGEVGDE